MLRQMHLLLYTFLQPANLVGDIMRSVPYPHPGKILKEEFLRPLAMRPEHLARRINVSLAHLEGIIAGRTFISTTIAHHLAACFATTASFWLNLQHGYDTALQSQCLVSTDAHPFSTLKHIKPQND